jgi:poly(hydroxyalkanoate) depolymerase family esterase
MLEALRLTRAGDLVQATALLQRTLHGVPVPGTDTGRVRVSDAASCKNVTPHLIDSAHPAGALEHIARAVPGSHSRVATTSPHVPHDKPRGQFLPLSFSSAAGTRAYKLYIPSGYQGRPCPLIVMLHGCTQSPDDLAEGTRMNVFADERTFLVAYPEQSSSANSAKCWNWFNRQDQQRDFGEPSLVAGITREVMQDYAVDRKRVYVAGMSAGAAAAAVLAATYPDVYAALGVHSGVACGLAHDVSSGFAAMSGGGDAPADGPDRLQAHDRRPIPTIVFHGDRDGTVHPRNGDRFAAEMSTADCDKRVETGQVHGGRSYTLTTYTDASDQRVFEQWVIHGAGHAWSGGSATGSFTDPQGPDASREMVRFFLSHQHPD